MKKITPKFFTIIFLLCSCLAVSQTLNQAANWPNANWTLSGTYTANTLLSDPTVAGTIFTFDDGVAGTDTSLNSIQATSPVIDLTAANGAGETVTETATSIGVLNPYTVMGLTPENNYEFYEQVDCVAIAAPYIEDFEAFTTSSGAFSDENCWTANSGTYYWKSAPGTDTGSVQTGPSPTITTGNYFYTEASGGSTGDTTDLVSPLVDLSGLTAPTLLFNYHMHGEEMGTLNVLVNGTTNVWTLSGEQQTLDTDPWKLGVIDLAAYVGQTIEVTFRGTSAGTFRGDISIDNISFIELPPCIDPIALTVTTITDTTADLGWTENGNATAWSIEIVDVSAGGMATGTPTAAGLTVNSYTHTGLVSNNNYSFYVRAECNQVLGVSNWVGPYAFTTLKIPTPSVLTASNITDATTELGWTENGVATSWNIELVDLTAGETVTGTASSIGVLNPYTAMGLTPENNYEFYVQADGGINGTSDWAGPYAFTTCATPPVLTPLSVNTCDNLVYLSGNNPGANTGVWTIASGSGTFGNATLYNTDVYNLGQGENVFIWTVVNGSGCIVSSQVTTISRLKNYYALDGDSSNQYCTDSTGWHHFYNANDEIIISIQGDISATPPGYPIASVAVNATYYQENEETGFTNLDCNNGAYTPGEERFEMARSWNFDFGPGATIPPYNVRFYYKPEERQAIETAAANFITSYPSCGYTYRYAPNFFWFQNEGTNYVAPKLDGTQLIGNENTVNSINYAEFFNVVNPSGGGSGAVILDPSPFLGEYLYEYSPSLATYFLGDVSDTSWADGYNFGILFRVKADVTNVPAGYPKFSLNVNSSYYQENESLAHTASDCSSGFSPGEQRFEMARSWSLDFGPGAILNAPYEAILFYDPAERIAMETAAANFITAHPDCGYTYKYASPNELYWFETSNANYTAPQYDGTHLNVADSGHIVLETSRPPNIEYFNYNYIHFTGLTGSGGSAAIILEPNNNTLDTNTNLFDENVSVYPNPSNGVFNVNLGALKNVSLRVLNMMGQTIYTAEQINSSTHKVALDNAAGIYFLEISANTKKQTYKLIFQ